jgi:hypothetical protein
MMMAMLHIDFEWWRDPTGYRMAGKETDATVVYHPPKHRPLHDRPCFQGNGALPISADDVLYFIERFGPLTKNGLDTSKGELVDGILAHSDAMRDLFMVLSGDRARRAKLIADLRMSPFADLDITLELDPASEDLKVRLCPTSLLDAIWLQAARELSSGAAVRQCRHCGDWFETGPRTGRRADAKFCSDEHRIVFNSLKRTKEN